METKDGESKADFIKRVPQVCRKPVKSQRHTGKDAREGVVFYDAKVLCYYFCERVLGENNQSYALYTKLISNIGKTVSAIKTTVCCDNLEISQGLYVGHEIQHVKNKLCESNPKDKDGESSG